MLLRSTFVVLATAMLASIAPLQAHDFWLEASDYRPRVGSLVGLRLLVGQDMLGDAVPRDPSAIERFIVRSGAEDRPVPGRDGGDPAGVARVASPGLLVVGYQSLPRPIELPPEKFAQYLGEEGLDEIASLLADTRRPSGVAHEVFSRCAKALVQSGPSAAGEADRALGLTLELVAARNPYDMSAGGELPFTLIYQGKPKANALVIAINRRDPTLKLTARTDARGRVAFAFPAAGIWLVKAVHMTAAPTGVAADWQSFWASLTFDLPARSDHGTR